MRRISSSKHVWLENKNVFNCLKKTTLNISCRIQENKFEYTNMYVYILIYIYVYIYYIYISMCVCDVLNILFSHISCT